MKKHTMPVLSEQEREELIADLSVLLVDKDVADRTASTMTAKIALAALTATPVVHEAEINGVMSSVTKSHFDDCEKYGVKTRKLYAVQVVPVKQEGEQ